jgi:hypothetical protein
MDHIENTPSNSSFVACVLVAAGTYLTNCCLERERGGGGTRQTARWSHKHPHLTRAQPAHNLTSHAVYVALWNGVWSNTDRRPHDLQCAAKSGPLQCKAEVAISAVLQDLESRSWPLALPPCLCILIYALQSSCLTRQNDGSNLMSANTPKSAGPTVGIGELHERRIRTAMLVLWCLHALRSALRRSLVWQ